MRLWNVSFIIQYEVCTGETPVHTLYSKHLCMIATPCVFTFSVLCTWRATAYTLHTRDIFDIIIYVHLPWYGRTT